MMEFTDEEKGIIASLKRSEHTREDAELGQAYYDKVFIPPVIAAAEMIKRYAALINEGDTSVSREEIENHLLAIFTSELADKLGDINENN